MLTIMQQDIINLLKNKPIMTYLLAYPMLLILVTGYVFSSNFTDDLLSAYDYYGVTMMIYLSMATVIILPELLFGHQVKYANYRIIYSPMARYKVYLSKLIVSIAVSYAILASYILVFNAIGFVNYGGRDVLRILLLDLALVIFSITFGGAFCLLVKSEDLATKLLNLVINLLAILSGLFFPMTILGPKIARVTSFSPVSKVMSSFFAIIYDKDCTTLLPTTTTLMLSSLIFLIIIHLSYHPEDFGD
ncbi:MULTISPECIES: ABC transporter permease [Aerococcus]|uniref:ABC transporter permease n=1 Tax=Aerococcus TaxID=1375 RepID=UPI000DCC946A|nr:MULTISPECIES: ABC transporter permease [Aerococcus]KAA9298514.1 ABC transporter permease [Aerococcus tenax]MDK6688721.1 ABC transporter permease [Aerococcus urinae]MDK8133176.1 ABC transporter permease [Aerococcus urinae]MDK8485290.1 ABC transporter permease [Aerococcus urinae]MDL5177812.1 ABC transporter permease [Aerococcus tenax]